MRKFSFEKLVRDKIVENIISSGDKPVYKILSDKDFIAELKKKILEEAKEILQSNGKDLVSELADLQQLINSLLKVIEVKSEELIKIQDEKNKKAGSFDKKHYIESVETVSGSKWEEYYLANPDKYPEVK